MTYCYECGDNHDAWCPLWEPLNNRKREAKRQKAENLHEQHFQAHMNYRKTMTYRAPDPTEEQIVNGKLKGYDPNMLGGSLPWWDLAPDDTLAAAAVIHDEMTLRGGSEEICRIVTCNYCRDAMILAQAVDSSVKRLFEQAKAAVFAQIVIAGKNVYWSAEDRNTPVTRKQGESFMNEAKHWINTCARKIGTEVPYEIAWEKNTAKHDGEPAVISELRRGLNSSSPVTHINYDSLEDVLEYIDKLKLQAEKPYFTITPPGKRPDVLQRIVDAREWHPEGGNIQVNKREAVQIRDYVTKLEDNQRSPRFHGPTDRPQDIAQFMSRSELAESVTMTRVLMARIRTYITYLENKCRGL